MRAAKLDWMQRQKEAFRNRQQVSHLVVRCVRCGCVWCKPLWLRLWSLSGQEIHL